MRTTAIFFDAGYFFAAAAEWKCGSSVPRTQVTCDFEGLVQAVKRWCEEQVKAEPVRLLRCYWYDGGRDGIPNEQHLRVAALQDVKLRLGRTTSGGQKGVDGLIILDLLTLARDGGLDTAFILSGDEDLREATLAAQQMGVRVVLMGIPPASQTYNQAATLVREADEHHVLPEDFWTRHLTRVGGIAPPIFTGSSAALDAGDPLRTVVRNFIGTVRAQLPSERLASIVDDKPSLPRYIDGQLLQAAAAHLGKDPEKPTKHALRATFWEEWDEASRG